MCLCVQEGRGREQRECVCVCVCVCVEAGSKGMMMKCVCVEGKAWYDVVHCYPVSLIPNPPSFLLALYLCLASHPHPVVSSIYMHPPRPPPTHTHTYTHAHIHTQRPTHLLTHTHTHIPYSAQRCDEEARSLRVLQPSPDTKWCYGIRQRGPIGAEAARPSPRQAG